MTYQSEDVVLCGVSDITSQKEIERTLRNAKQVADKASEAKTMFFATISHEIRTPLYGILGTLELLALTGLSGQQQQYLNTIQQSSSTLLRTINDTLDLSRIEAGRQELDIAEFSPSDILERVVANYAARAQGKGLLIYAITDIDVPAAVLGDATRILQVLNNLVSNAVKFTEAGRVAVRAAAVVPSPGRVSLRFQVADTGVGIPADSQAQLFEPYFRAHAGLERDISGTGLGLAICRRLSDLMGGSLSVVSEEGLGTSIVFTLTLDVSPTPAPAPLRRRAVARRRRRSGGRRQSVRLAECVGRGGYCPIAATRTRSNSRDAVLVQAWPPAAQEPAGSMAASASRRPAPATKAWYRPSPRPASPAPSIRPASAAPCAWPRTASNGRRWARPTPRASPWDCT